MQASQSQVEAFYSALAFKQIPILKGKVKLTFNPKSRYLFEARRNGAWVKLEIGFAPATPDWQRRLHRAVIAANELRQSGQPELVAHRLPTAGQENSTSQELTQ